MIRPLFVPPPQDAAAARRLPFELRLSSSRDLLSRPHRTRILGLIKKLVEHLVDTVQVNVDARIVENYAVPVAMASLILDEKNNAEAMLREALELVPVEREFSSDHDDLLATIMESHLPVSEEGTVSVRQAILSVLASSKVESAKHDALKLCGIRVLVKDQRQFVLFAPRIIERYLLNRTNWKGKNIRTILRRILGTVESQQRFDEHRDRAIVVPVSELELLRNVEPILELLEAEK